MKYLAVAANREKHIASSKAWKHRNAELYYARRSKLRQVVRDAIHTKLGDKCIRCGFADKRALQIDHIHGGGCQEARTRGDWAVHYARVLEWPDGKLFATYQLLCANCNRIKMYENKEIPGLRLKEDTDVE